MIRDHTGLQHWVRERSECLGTLTPSPHAPITLSITSTLHTSVKHLSSKLNQVISTEPAASPCVLVWSVLVSLGVFLHAQHCLS